MRCQLCHNVIDLENGYYKCETCKSPIILCVLCAEDPESGFEHEHPLTRQRGVMQPRILFRSQGSLTSGIILTNCAGVLPGSPLYKECSVGAVLSLLSAEDCAAASNAEDPDSATFANMYDQFSKEEQELLSYAYSKGNTDASVRKGIVYNLVPLRDVSRPDLLSAMEVEDLFAEATCFIDMARASLPSDKSVAVHCYLGRRRSPTVVLAWMLTKGATVHAAIKEIGEQHAVKGWDDEFNRQRSGWVEWLLKWKMSWKVIQNKWKSYNPETLTLWKELFDNAAAGKDTPEVEAPAANEGVEKEGEGEGEGEGEEEEEGEGEKSEGSSSSSEDESNDSENDSDGSDSGSDSDNDSDNGSEKGSSSGSESSSSDSEEEEEEEAEEEVCKPKRKRLRHAEIDAESSNEPDPVSPPSEPAVSPPPTKPVAPPSIPRSSPPPSSLSSSLKFVPSSTKHKQQSKLSSFFTPVSDSHQK